MINSESTYTLFVRGPGNSLKPRQISANEAELFMDVPAEKPMWARYSGLARKELGETTYWKTRLEVHVHSAKDLKGGELNRGKFGIETNNPVE